jgi:hypothetical protein
MHPCDNCGYNAPTVDRTATITDPHTDEEHTETFALCDTCADAFDLGAGNA